MELIFLILLVIGIFYFISNKKEKSPDYEITINGKPVGSSNYDDYEDYYGLDDEENKHPIYDAEYPMFFALKNEKKLLDTLNSDLSELATHLSKQKSDNVKSAVYQMMNQDSFKEMKGLPKYLQVVPIKTLLSNKIFVNPNESNLDELLNSMTMDILRGYCSEYEIKPGKSKKATVEILLDSPIKTSLDYNQYFRLNPKVREINSHFGEYCQSINQEQLEKSNITMRNLTKKLDPDELNEDEARGNYRLQEYGYSSVVLFKNNKPLFKIMEFSMNAYGDYVLLLKDGKFLCSQNCRIDDFTTMRVSIINEDKKILRQYIINDINNYDLSELDDKPIVFLSLLNKDYWTLNYETLDEKIINNPEDLDIYTLIDSKL